LRGGVPGWRPQSHDSLAVTRAGERFALVNPSPDVLAQLQATRALWPRAPRHSPIGAIVLTNGDLDHVLGLFCLRESMPIAVYATDAVWSGLEASVFLRTLQRFPEQLSRRVLVPGEEIALSDAKGAALGVWVRPFALPGKPPVHLMGHAAPSPGDNIGLALR